MMDIVFQIPDDSKCLVTKGQNVDFDSPFLEKNSLSDLSVPISSKLQVAPQKIFKYLKKFVGDDIKKGDLLAEKKTLLSRKTVMSEFSGIIKEINHHDGNLVISAREAEAKNIKAFFKGEIVEITKNALTLKVKDGKEFELQNSTQDFGGKNTFIKGDNSIHAMNVVFSADKILIIESISSYLQRKAEALGIKGLVTLKNLSSDPRVPQAQVKNPDDFAQVLKTAFPYCFINKQSSRIYFYS